LTCEEMDPKFLGALGAMGVEAYRVPCRTLLGYPMLAIEQAQKLVERADAVWITDVEYSTAPRIKRVKKVHVVAHIYSYALVRLVGRNVWSQVGVHDEVFCVEDCWVQARHQQGAGEGRAAGRG
jgi:hypothetical protein